MLPTSRVTSSAWRRGLPWRWAGGALIVGTILTVVVAQIDLGHTTNLVLALLIAATKGTLVAAIFMHLKWERSVSVWASLGLCAAFFVFLMAVPVLTVNDYPPGVKHDRTGSWDVLPEVTATEHGGGH